MDGKGSTYGARKSFMATLTDSSGEESVLSDAVQYVHSMDADTNLLRMMAKENGKNINTIPYDELTKLGVVNNGETRTNWTTGSTETTLYLRGERKTPHGVNKVILTCTPPGPIMLYIVFDPEGRADEISQMTDMSLLLDDKELSFSDRRLIGPELLNGWIVALFSLDDPLLDSIQKAKAIGFTFQQASNHLSFIGFNHMVVKDAAKKLTDMRPSCQ